ncbi:ABC transporter permease [bacterium]|nr:ABC transporter permease [bacterium]
MFQNYLKIALRTIVKQKAYALLNIFGLGAGLACFIVIALYVRREWNYDRFQDQSDRLYRVILQRNTTGVPQPTAAVSYGVADIMKHEFPSIEKIGRMYRFGQDAVLRAGDNIIGEPNFIFSEPEMLDLLSIRLTEGDPAIALKEPQSLIVTQNTAHRLFGNVSALGKTVRVRINTIYVDYKITGVTYDYPENSHFTFQALASFEDFRKYVVNADFMTSWFNYGFWTYFRIKDPAAAGDVHKQLATIVQKHFPETRKGSNFELQSVKDIHLYSQTDSEVRPNGNAFYIYTFSIIGLLVLVVAGINYVNLATAQSERRSKEVGVRKVMGAERRQLILQFLTESVAQTAFAFLIALGLSELLVVVLNQSTNLGLALQYSDPALAVFGLFLIVMVGLGAGFYPAMVLSSFSPVRNLRVKAFRPVFNLRQVLVVSQLTVTAGLISAVWVIQQQVKFVQSTNLGFEKEQNVLIRALGSNVALNQNYERFKYQTERLPGVASVTRHSWIAGEGYRIRSMFFGPIADDQGHPVQFIFVGYDYLKTYGLELVEGRDFSQEFISDSSGAYIVNESAVRAYKLDNPIGRIIASGDRGPVSGPIVGVVKDFHFASLHQPIEPMVIGLFNFAMPYITVRLKAGHAQETIAAIEDIWNSMDQEKSMDYSFLDHRLDQVYRFESQLSKITTIFTVLSIGIGCLGLFGLVAAVAEKRTKEIGVRKVLGASTGSILMMFVKEFTAMAVLSTLLAIPMAYWILSGWLEGFAYRINIGVEPFVIALSAMLILTLVTVSHRALKAASAKPVDALKYE